MTTVRSAEMVKLCCNNFHALKITFANEIARLCSALAVDPFEVMDLLCKDTQLNISKAYLKPGHAFGGSCLPKDLRATLYLAKQRDVELPMLANVLASNRLHVERAIDMVLATASAARSHRLSFKSGTDDLREPDGVPRRAVDRQGYVAVGLRSRSTSVTAPWREQAIHRAPCAAHRQPAPS
jgi:GDP-mannose 6-dehydrogenase